MARFPRNDIMSLTEQAPRYDLAESVGPDLRLGQLLGQPGNSDYDELALGYGTAEGNPELRQLLGELHGVDADDVLLTVGGMHALFITAFVLCDRGDEAVTTSPVFPPTRNVLETIGAKVRTLNVSFDSGYQIDLDDLRAQLNSRTTLVSLASPQNPSGVALSLQTIEQVLDAMKTRCPGACLLLDETYRDAVYGDNRPAASAVSLSGKVITCASLSKCHGAPGLRLGWAITRNAELREQLVRAKFNTVISCSVVDEALALKALQQRDTIIGERRKHLADGLAVTASWAEANADLIDWVRPDAGALCCMRLKPTVFDDVSVGRFYEVLEREGVRVGNGAWFGEESRVFRLGFGLLSMEDLEAGLMTLATVMRRTARAAA